MKKLLCLFVLLCPLFAQTPPHNSVTLTILASPTSTVTGYNVYQSNVSGSGYLKIGSTGTTTPIKFTTPVLDGGTAGGAGITYFFIVRAFRPPCTTCSPAESTPVESVNSTEATAFIAAPPLPPPLAPAPPANVTTVVN